MIIKGRAYRICQKRYRNERFFSTKTGTQKSPDEGCYHFLIRAYVLLVCPENVTAVHSRTGLLSLQKIRNFKTLLHHIAADIHRLLNTLYGSGIRLHGNSLRSAGLHHVAYIANITHITP